MSRIFLDSNLFIYQLEDAGARGNRANFIFERLSRRKDTVLTSTLTVGEVLVKPLRTGNRALETKYRDLLREPEVRVLAFDRAAGEMFARIRVDRAIKAADAIQLATAASAGCDLFITNDDRLTAAHVPGIQFIVSMDRAPI
ncbi:MAG: PIN domain-containing protein [Terracidiphilus sp.]|jgi:predicted nucleic acid-binding protein